MDETFYRVSGIFLAHDPLGLMRFQQHGEYDAYVPAVLACETREDLMAVLVSRCVYTEPLYRSLKYFLGLEEHPDDLYPRIAQS